MRNKILIRKLITATACVLFFQLIIAGVKGQVANITFQNSFEDRQNINSYLYFQKCCSYSINVVDSVHRSGNSSLRFELNKTDNLVSKGKRAEVVVKSQEDLRIDHWYAFSIFLPTDFEVDSVHEILAQWHDSPDAKLGEGNRSPALSLQILKSDWKIPIRWANQALNDNKSLGGKKTFGVGKIDPGTWTDWIFHVKFSYQQDGILQVWKNKVLVVDYTGPNYYNDEKGPYLKFGIYKSPWLKNNGGSVISHRVVYFDDLFIGTQNSSLEDMKRLSDLNK